MLRKGYYEFGPYRADLAQGVLERNGQLVHLTPKAFEILIVLLENAGKIVSKDTLLERVWPDTTVEEGNLAYNINMLRRALDDKGDSPRYIETYRKRGYKFAGEVKYMPEDTGVGSTADRVAGVIEGEPNEASAVEQPTPSNSSSDDGQGAQARWWKRYHKVIIGPASDIIIVIIIVAAVLLSPRDPWSEPEKVFPQFGEGTISENSRNISEMKRRLKRCQGNCLEDVERVLVIDTILEEGGFAIVIFDKPFGSDIALKRQIVLKVKLSTHNPMFEVGLQDARQTTVHFDCQAPASGQEYDYLVSLDAESLTKNGSKLQPQHTRSLSVGFATDAGSTPDRQQMEVFGIVSSDNFPVTSETRPCKQRSHTRVR
ncbi:MAG TPA: transcriptional regulator [Blastocatellia bacterium]|nr:transcriptional regulator [Blastocatellia bacterium]